MNEQELERLIEQAGRSKVFAYARAAGWSLTNSPPQWVWAQIAHEVMRATPPEKQEEAQR